MAELKGQQINGSTDSLTDTNKHIDKFYDKWGFGVEDLYKLSLTLFKEKDGGKALQLTYKDKLRLVALTKQVTFGKYRPDVMPEVGFLDVVGNDRKQAWQSLGEMTKEEAMIGFVSHLDRLCPLFAPYIEAHAAERDELQRKRRNEEEEIRRQEFEMLHVAETSQRQDEERRRQHSQEMLIRTALNQQTAVQFREYTEQHCPNNPLQQQELITQLQEQHFIQYMQQVYQQQIQQQQQQAYQQQIQQQQAYQQQIEQQQTYQQQIQQQQAYQQQMEQQKQEDNQHNSTNIQSALGSTPSSSPQATPTKSPPTQDMPSKEPPTSNTSPNHSHSGAFDDSPSRASLSSPQRHVVTNGNARTDAAEKYRGDDDDIDGNDLPPVAAASMWTRKDIREFKDSLKNDPESVIKVGSGELVTVRVPTHDDGSCLFWEFATDGYDIGFGVFFEWTIATSNQVSVQVSEESEEEEPDEDGVSGRREGDTGKSKTSENEPPTDEIIPAYRRDCHSEVYCGSHVYPGRGVYLLKFDNSYSLWRGKTVYYRVYYTR